MKYKALAISINMVPSPLPHTLSHYITAPSMLKYVIFWSYKLSDAPVGFLFNRTSCETASTE